ncbi:MAG TPA: ATP-binding cassette domain-containing protein, partial [Candidatus Polarisedimenticolia bacterium]|nr:ATP-binding cassette domain-containing protein [Candidatus Polarisedimenticolia bacterium]
MDILIRVDKLRKSYGDLTAVDQLSFEIRRNETFGLLGPNGAGKSTTLHLLAGLLRPDSGSIIMSGTLQVGIDPAREAEGGYLQGLLIQATFEGLKDRLMNPGELRPTLRRSIAGLEESRPGLPDEQRTVISTFLKDLDGFLGNVDAGTLREAGPALEPLEIQTIPVMQERSGPLNAFEVS